MRNARDQLVLPDGQSDSTLNDRIHVLALDVTDSNAAEAYVQKALEVYGRLDISIQCAGICPPSKSILETSEEEFDKLMDVNVKGVWMGCKASLRGMLQSPEGGKGGSIVLISSQIGLDGTLSFSFLSTLFIADLSDVGMPGLTPYTTSKFALRGLMASLAQEVGPLGIRVNSIAPGPINTPLYIDFPDKEAHEARSNLKRAGEADEIANSVVYLCSEAGAFCSGTTLKVDGGWSKWC